MTKIKLNILKTFILLFSSSILLLTSCSDNDTEQIQSKDSIENLNTVENRNIITNLYKEGTEENLFLKQKISESKNNLNYRTNESDFDIEAEIENYRNCSDCPSEYKSFMIPFIEEMAITHDSELLSLISDYDTRIDNLEADLVIKENLRFILFTFYEAANYNINNSEGNLAQRTSGNKVALGIAGGFITGCATGAYIGGTAGTVTVPIIGTVVGAVSGCIAAGAWSATMGAAAGGFWTLFD
ncbi:hypothetical protein [Flavobacterium sp.]|uniref:hypothetical protein n=2 Tax=Flavobacterium sp. TaxID=239 RepID=UPI004047DC47